MSGRGCVTADEITNPSSLDIALRLNGKTMQRGNTRDMIFNSAKVIAYLSTVLPLQPGDVIATGTPAGVGFSRKPPVFMQPGDVCEVEFEKIGVLCNRIALDET